MSRLSFPRLDFGPRQPEPLPARLRSKDEVSQPCRLIAGDNAQVLSGLAADYRGQVTLAYLDPPFLTGRQHNRIVRKKNEESGVYERSAAPAFDDRWDDVSEYLAHMELRIRLIRELLSDEGSMVLHVDPKTSHFLKLICDEVFGPECFASEVIWRYRRWPAKTRNFQKVHDVMLRYVKNPEAKVRFHQLYEPLAPSTQATWGTRKQRAVTDENGRRVRSSKTEGESRGAPLGDVWEISIVAPVAKERTGYPTQKPLKLLQRWIDACSSPGDLVLDPYMGSGTTLAAALGSGRRAIGIDQGSDALEVTSRRLKDAGHAFCQEQADLPLARTAGVTDLLSAAGTR